MMFAGSTTGRPMVTTFFRSASSSALIGGRILVRRVASYGDNSCCGRGLPAARGDGFWAAAASATELSARRHPVIAAAPSCAYFSSSNSTQIEKERVAIPPNLTFDPRSSFAPEQIRHKAKPKAKPVPPKDEDEEEEDHEMGEYEEEEEEDDDEVLYLTQPEVRYAIPLPERLNVEIHTLFAPKENSLCGKLILDETVFGLDPIRVDLLKRSVNYYRAKKRGKRTAHSRTVSEKSGSGRKLRPQKGTGRARVGHGRPPHFRGGARAHGKKNTTDYGNTKLNKKVRTLALRHALSAKLKEGNLLILNHLHELPTHKTRELERLLTPWDWGIKEGRTAMLLDHYYTTDDADDTAPTSYRGVPVNWHVASGNLYKLHVGNTHQACPYKILKHEKLVLTVAAVQELERRYTDA